MFESDYPPAAFHFKVVFAATAGKFDSSFREVSGIKASIETEDFSELGENEYVYRVPKKPTYTDLELKRGIAPITSPLVLWCKSIFEGYSMMPIVPLPMMVYLMNEDNLPKRAWGFTGAFPVSWEVDRFDAMKGEVAIETIKIRYNKLTRML